MVSLRSLPIAFRALFSSFLILIGVGYLMALTYMYLVVIEPHRQMGQGLVAGISDEYHGMPKGKTLLEVGTDGADGRQDIGCRPHQRSAVDTGWRDG